MLRAFMPRPGGLALLSNVSTPSTLDFFSIQRRWRFAKSKSLLVQYYKGIPVRKKYRTALKRGLVVWDHNNGCIKLPPVAVQGYDENTNPYRGTFENCRSTRVWYKD
mmetsp:Transcript_2296/g.5081  ORF Transcript_2296/g.5081 Transcript_2296/m.5081 type:complete len:107 (-) Transcript_2296:49-369(-)